MKIFSDLTSEEIIDVFSSLLAKISIDYKDDFDLIATGLSTIKEALIKLNRGENDELFVNITEKKALESNSFRC